MADEDEDLKRALALSLLQSEQVVPPPRKRNQTILVSDGSETENSEDQAPKAKKQKTVPLPKGETASALPASLNPPRADLERERLARQAAREASGTASTSKVTLQPSSGARVATFSSLRESGPSSQPSAAPSASSSSGLQYPNGHLSVTWNRNFPNDRNSMSFGQIMGDKKTLKSATICAYCIEFPWIVEQFDSTTPVCVVHDGPEAGFFTTPEVPNIARFVPKPSTINKYTKMHVKFLLFFHTTHVRLVIPTANLMGYDWSIIENSLWLIDLPLLPKPTDAVPKSTFAEPLFAFLTSLALPPKFWRAQLGACDWSRCSDFRLCISLAGEWVPSSTAYRDKAYGFPALGRAVRELECRPGKNETLHLECQGSSTSFYEEEWLNAFYHALPSAKSALGSRLPPLKVLFPSEKTVNESLEGRDWAISWFCQAKVWAHSKLDRMILDPVSKRKGLLMHTKMIAGIVKADKEAEEEPEERTRGFLYVGSHNFTKGAWGRLSSKSLRISNTELGVVLPVKARTQKEADTKLSEMVCWSRPANVCAYAGDSHPYFIDNARAGR